jgi:hypothetical protein
MNNSNNKELDEKELMEILELAKEAANSARELCHIVAKHNEKWRKKAEKKAQNEVKNINYGV